MSRALWKRPLLSLPLPPPLCGAQRFEAWAGQPPVVTVCVLQGPI